MKYCLLSLPALALTLALAVPAPAMQKAGQFIAALEAYKAGDYPKAIAGLEALAQNDLRNGKLFYNLGNAYLKADNLGRAILWYERALQLLPNDPDLRFNYDYVCSLTQDVQEENTSPLVRIFFFWKYQLSAGTIKRLAIGFNLLFWGLAIGWRLARRHSLRRAAWMALLPALIFVLTAAYNFYEVAHLKQAIVLPEEISVRSGLQETSTELFTLHAGAKVNVVKALKDHYQIRFSEDKIGWVAQKTVGVI